MSMLTWKRRRYMRVVFRWCNDHPDTGSRGWVMLDSDKRFVQDFYPNTPLHRHTDRFGYDLLGRSQVSRLADAIAHDILDHALMGYTGDPKDELRALGAMHLSCSYGYTAWRQDVHTVAELFKGCDFAGVISHASYRTTFLDEDVAHALMDIDPETVTGVRAALREGYRNALAFDDRFGGGSLEALRYKARTCVVKNSPLFYAPESGANELRVFVVDMRDRTVTLSKSYQRA